jgi:anti-sigma regulatory factor (Ser/Thr protein kinase)/predicted transcriptional regulator
MRNMQVDNNKVRQFILENVSSHPGDITRRVMEQFGISRQAANKHLQRLVSNGLIEAKGKTSGRQYTLKPLTDTTITLKSSPDLEEDRIWRERVHPLLKGISLNVLEICHYGFTEMFNNVIDHSGGEYATIRVLYTPAQIEIHVIDDGVGIFQKIKTELGLEDERHAILELSKGKLTTDPERHTGEGIFFTSRVFDRFYILSTNLRFIHEGEDDWLLEEEEKHTKGTSIGIIIQTQSKRTVKEVFDRYAAEQDDYGFTRTHVPVALAQYPDENLVSRSQAKRLLARFDRFKEVFLDFARVQRIGQAFADEIFRVFRKSHPNIRLVYVNANKEVEVMIHRAETGK